MTLLGRTAVGHLHAPLPHHQTTAVPVPAHHFLFSSFTSSLLAFTSTSCRTKLTNTSSATARPDAGLAHRDALAAHTHPEAALAAVVIATSTAAPIAVHVRLTVVRQAREVTSLTAQVEELRRVQWKARTT
jgi:hypothetical protein